MKDKTKKIMAGIGLGTMIGASGLFMTGCTMPGEDSARLMEIAENVNDIVTDIKDNVTKEQVYDLMRVASSKIDFYDDAVYANTKVSMVTANGTAYLSFYKLPNGLRVYINQAKVEGEDELILNGFASELEDGTMLTSNDGVTKSIATPSFETETRAAGSDGVYPLINGGAIDFASKSIDNILDYEILENGNYLIYTSYMRIEPDTTHLPDIEEVDVPYIGIFEITPDGLIKNGTLKIKRTKDNKVNIYSIDYKYEYGVLDKDDIQSFVNKITALPNA